MDTPKITNTFKDFTINHSTKFYPEANEWMWDYCFFLGSFTDSKGKNFDLGIHIEEDGEICDATVHSNKPGDYTSGEFRDMDSKDENREFKIECYNRAKCLGFFKNKK